MKNIIALIMLVSASFFATAQTDLPTDPTTTKVSYAGVVDALGISKKQLFDNAKKWIATKNSTTNPYTVSYENEQSGEVTGKGSFALPGDRKKYVVQFAIKIAVKDGKFKYELTDFIIQYHTQAGASSGGYGPWGSTSYHEAENLEYSLETFYPARVNGGRKPAVKWYEEIGKKSFETINREASSLISSLKQSLSSQDNW